LGWAIANFDLSDLARGEQPWQLGIDAGEMVLSVAYGAAQDPALVDTLAPAMSSASSSSAASSGQPGLRQIQPQPCASSVLTVGTIGSPHESQGTRRAHTPFVTRYCHVFLL